MCALYLLFAIILINRFCIFTKRWYLKLQANMQYVRRDCTMLQYRVLMPGRYRFNLVNTPEKFVIVLAIISMCDFHDIFSFKFNPRKLKLLTLSIGILSYCYDWVINIFVYGMKTHVLSFSIFKESLFTVNQLYTPLNSLLISIVYVSGVCISL